MYICISVLMNYDCTTYPVVPFITITTIFFSKHCMRRVLDAEMNSYHVVFLQSVDPKQPKNVKYSL